MITAFLLTVAIECGLACIFRSAKLVYAVFLCNLLTNPLLNLLLILYRQFVSSRYGWLLAALEIAVLFGEAALIRAMTGAPYSRTLLQSLLFNGGSFLIGLMLSEFGIWL